MIRLISRIAFIATLSGSAAFAADDPYLWLEEVQDEKALDWVRDQNAKTFDELRDNDLYKKLYDEAFAILTSDARIPKGSIIGDHFYNFWQDDVHIRGIWRRTSLDDYIAGSPQWETVLDFDALEEAEHENWVYHGYDCLGGDSDHCLMELSHGGKDESVHREFSLTSKTFVEGGFLVPEAKSNVSWAGEDALLVGTDWGDGSLTNSGYALEIRLWKRGTDLHAGKSLFKADVVDTLVAPFVVHNDEQDYSFIVRLFADWNEKQYMRVVDGAAGEPMNWPLRVSFEGILAGRAILALEQDWDVNDTRYKIGDIIASDLDDGDTELVFSPAARQAVTGVATSATSVFVELLDNVKGRLKRIQRSDDGWEAVDIALPDNGVVKLAATSSVRDDAFVSYESSIQPTTMYHVDTDNAVVPVASMAPLYDATDVVIRQEFATSADGESVPYFLIGRKDVLEEGDAPTILYGYGGFSIPILPVYYSDPSRPQHGALAGRMWISRGGVLAIANLRGGGEFGPRWHQSALRENRQRAYDDYFAIAEDLIDTGITTSKKLGALGRSNGGLLLGVALTQRPDLFAALDIGVPLLDMLRYNKLLAGASWMGEYGNPDVPEDREFIEKYSPYQNLDADQEYPKVLFYTSTLDDRVHPGHARKMAAKMADMGHEFFYYENIEGGHGGTANQEQLAMRTALEYAYFVRMLMPTIWDSTSD
ncbi:MAG: S9 family peptidase [Proteobacteria bacterium]|nr:S9 family peptidase [Pseudomonadota bacterium]